MTRFAAGASNSFSASACRTMYYLAPSPTTVDPIKDDCLHEAKPCRRDPI